MTAAHDPERTFEVRLCTRNDAIINVSVIVAGGSIFGDRHALPRYRVAVVAVPALKGSYRTIANARAELWQATAGPVAAE